MRVFEAITETGVTCKQFAKTLSCDRYVLSRIVGGKVLPTVPLMREICQGLDCGPLDLYDREELALETCLGPNGQPVATAHSAVKRKRRLCVNKHYRMSCGDAEKLRRAVKKLGYRCESEWFAVVVKEVIEKARQMSEASSEREANEA